MREKLAGDWVRFAEKDLHRAELLANSGDLDGAVYHLQQCAEKSLKAVIINLGESVPRTHSINILFKFIMKRGIKIPPEISSAEILTQYAFTTRYPDDYVPVSKEEYEEAYKIAKRVLKWAKEIVRP